MKWFVICCLNLPPFYSPLDIYDNVCLLIGIAKSHPPPFQTFQVCGSL